MNEERVYDKLDSLEQWSREVLVAVTRVEEQVKDMPDLKVRVSALERWRWTAMGAMAASGGSLALSLFSALKGGG